MKSVIPVAAGIISVGALIYLYIRRREKDKKDKSSDPEPDEVLEFIVKNQQVPAIVGRNSVVLRSIEDRTKTQIKLKESDENHQICSIRGKKINVKEAKHLIDVEASKPCVITDELLVPVSSCGQIEAGSGSFLHEICSKSSAKVWVDPGSRKNLAENRRVLITGTEQQVALAKKLIEEKIKEVPGNSETKKEEFKREPRLPSPSQYASNSSITTTETPRELLLPSPEKLKNNEGQLEVFVSAVNSPSRFWVQLVGPQSTELDFLVDAMTEYYNQKENQELHQIREPYLGQIVAAMFFSDNKWYRAEIVAIQVNESMPQELLFDVYFLDYGDSQFIGKKDILELRADFLSLRFQAIECFLAHIKPHNADNKLDEWDEKTVEKFENMVQAAKWKKLISKVVTYKERQSFAFQRQSNKRESSPIPGVELYDPEENTDKNIGFELVKLGLAEMEPFGDLSNSSILKSTPVGADKSKEEKQTVKVERSKVPNETITNEEITNNPVQHTNGDSKNKKLDSPSPLFTPDKPAKTSKKQKVSDFLKNEQQATSQFNVKAETTDWNTMLDD